MLDSLYQEVILEHNRSPRNFGAMEHATGSAHGRNPLCGDEVTIWVKLDGDVIREASFVGTGCAISRASASMMTQAIVGRTRAEAEALFTRFHQLVTGAPAGDAASLGRLKVFGGVARFPTRVKCASLAWHAMKHAIAAGDAPGAAATRPGS